MFNYKKIELLQKDLKNKKEIIELKSRRIDNLNFQKELLLDIISNQQKIIESVLAYKKASFNKENITIKGEVVFDRDFYKKNTTVNSVQFTFSGKVRD